MVERAPCAIGILPLIDGGNSVFSCRIYKYFVIFTKSGDGKTSNAFRLSGVTMNSTLPRDVFELPPAYAGAAELGGILFDRNRKVLSVNHGDPRF